MPRLLLRQGSCASLRRMSLDILHAARAARASQTWHPHSIIWPVVHPVCSKRQGSRRRESPRRRLQRTSEVAPFPKAFPGTLSQELNHPRHEREVHGQQKNQIILFQLFRDGGEVLNAESLLFLQVLRERKMPPGHSDIREHDGDLRNCQDNSAIGSE